VFFATHPRFDSRPKMIATHTTKEKALKPSYYRKRRKMKFSAAFLLVAPVVAFTPSVNFAGRNNGPLKMSTEASAETKVRTTIILSNENPFDGHDKLILIIS
jgi:hypothetical protein